jgi:hypothetical protein
MEIVASKKVWKLLDSLAEDVRVNLLMLGLDIDEKGQAKLFNIHMLKRSIGVLLLLAFLSVKYAVIFGQIKQTVKAQSSQSPDDSSEESKEKEEETKEAHSTFDELYCQDQPQIVFQMPSRIINTYYFQISTTAHLPSLYLPPEV